jgi:hypothetical protein
MNSLGLLAYLACCGAMVADSPRFSHEVMAVLSRVGCNSGPCHGNLNGKGGFKLSLRGDDASWDYRVLVREQTGRRVNISQPGESLILKKAIGAVPHEGGKLFGPNSREYQILSDWIAAGCPQGDRGNTLADAHLEFDSPEVMLSWEKPQTKLRLWLSRDGARSEVTDLVAWETTNLSLVIERDGTVLPGPLAKTGQRVEGGVVARLLDRQVLCRVAILPTQKAAWTEPAAIHPIDIALEPRLKTLGIVPSPVASDEVFLKRIYLDLLGILPTSEEAKTFLADKRPDRRERLVDALLVRPEFPDFWAIKWADVLRVEEKTLDANGVRGIHGWLRRAFAENKPLNEMARELVSSRGSTYEHPEANFYRALRDPENRTEAIAQVFLGIRIACAKCHNHPFDRWKQEDYHALAAALSPIDYKVLENKRGDNLDKHEFVGDQIVFLRRGSRYSHPVTKKPLAPAFLGTAAPKDQDTPARLADWIADPKNPFFARAQVNRIWRHMTGKGLVDPEDDFRITNPPSRPELLDLLTLEFQRADFQIKPMIRMIATSRAYQRSAQPSITGDDPTHTSQAMLRALTAEQLLDALSRTTGSELRFEGLPRGTRVGQIPGVISPATVGSGPKRNRRNTLGEVDRFLRTFGKPERLLSCDCERTEDTTLAQALQLVSGEMVQKMLTDPENRLGEMVHEGIRDEQAVQDLWLAGLSRYPTRPETEAAMQLLEKGGDRRVLLEDLLWGILSSREFLLRH